MLTIPIHCPHCRAHFVLSAQLRGKRVRCRECQETFTVEPEDVLEARPVSRDEDLQAGLERNPHRRRRARPFEDDEPAPRRRPARPVERHSGSSQGLLIGGAVAALFVVAAGVGGAVWLFSSRSASTNAGPSPGAEQVVNAGGGAEKGAIP